MQETWHDYIRRLQRNYKVELHESDTGALTDDGRRIVTLLLVREHDGLYWPCPVPVDDLSEHVRDYHYKLVSQQLRIPESHADR